MRELNRNAGACLPRVQPILGPIYQRGLSRTDLTGKGDEALAILDAIHQPTLPFFDLFRQIKVARVRVSVEQGFLQVRKTLIHGPNTLADTS